MPGSVANAVPVGVLPWHLAAAFQQSRKYPILGNEYADGASQRSLLGETSRKQWEISLENLEYYELEVLRNFFEDHHGSLIPFYMYDVFETVPKFSYPDGSDPVGRYTVRFGMDRWEQSSTLGISGVSLTLIELA